MDGIWQQEEDLFAEPSEKELCGALQLKKPCAVRICVYSRNQAATLKSHMIHTFQERARVQKAMRISDNHAALLSKPDCTANYVADGLLLWMSLCPYPLSRSFLEAHHLHPKRKDEHQSSCCSN
ncbi:hypothetical protein OPV22_024018 [Ensete ventricosum]|uniref:BED-type domain-containing protein n=1 Tax=Ensete ventricosum TaxID=4639 RepID=A0AAV8PDC9_ENSVE|nr:hypothetical protein OPV22_024018 [Ensete ventricosum]